MKIHLLHQWGPWSFRRGEGTGMLYMYRECRTCAKSQVSLR